MINLQGSRFTDIMPENLASQLETQAFAYALGRQIEKLCAYADGVHIYAAVASMPEKILDVLAVELQTPAYNQKFSIEVKRTLVEGTLAFYAHMGTPATCNRIIEIIFGSGYIEEWFSYQGNPHHFRVHVTRNESAVSIEKFEEFIRTISTVKRLSSWLDEVITTICIPPALLHIGGVPGTHVQMGLPQREDEFDFQSTLHAGGTGGIHASAGVHEAGDDFSFRDKVFAGGKFSTIEKFPVPESTAPPPATTILRTGGVCTILSNLSKGE